MLQMKINASDEMSFCSALMVCVHEKFDMKSKKLNKMFSRRNPISELGFIWTLKIFVPKLRCTISAALFHFCIVFC